MGKSIKEITEEEIEDLRDVLKWDLEDIQDSAELINKEKKIMDACNLTIEDEIQCYISYGNKIKFDLEEIVESFDEVKKTENEISILKLILQRFEWTN